MKRQIIRAGGSFNTALFVGALIVGCGPAPDPSGPTDTGEPLPYETSRRVMHEVFTGSTCGPCFEADATLEGVLYENAGRYAVLKYQVGSDPYVSSEGVSRRMYYLPGKSSYSIPYVHADGRNGFHPSEINDDAGYQQSDFDGFAEVPALIELSTDISVEGQTVNWKVDVLPLSDIASEDLVLHIGIAEGVTYNNIGTNGQTEFHHVMKKMVPDEDGQSIQALVRGSAISLEGAYTFQGEYAEDAAYGNEVQHDVEHTVEEFDDLGLVVWIQDETTWEVYQSAWTFE